MCNLGLKFFAEQDILTDAGHLSMGYLRPSAEILEHYSCGGSPYWAAKAFSLLLIPEDDSFWQVEEKPLPIHRQSYSEPVKSAGVVMVGDSRHDLHAARAAGMVAVGVLTGVAGVSELSDLAEVVLPDIGHLGDWIATRG